MTSLSTIPPNINTYPPVLSSTVTQERHRYALARPNPAPSTSLLNISGARRSNRLDAPSGSSETPWISRSKLGEPDAPAPDVPLEAQDPGRGRWSLWGRKTGPETPLVTSGGGLLEIKAVALVPARSVARSSTEMKTSISQSPSQTLRPSSPSPSQPLPHSNHQDEVGHSSPSGVIGAPDQPGGPSVVSRFFGRLARKPSAPRTPSVDPRDLELSADDFSYLSEVPSMSAPPSERGIGDLLSMESGRTEEIASLESMLSSKSTVLPKPLAPPPRGAVPSSFSRTPSNSSVGSARFMPKLKKQPSTDMDLLSGLDFVDESGSRSPSSPAAPAAVGTSPSSNTSSPWDEFLASSKPPPPPRVPSGPLSSSSQSSAPMSPTVTFHPAPPPQGQVDGFSAFDEIDTPRPHNVKNFDDFGDFSAFDSEPPFSANGTGPTPVLRPSPSLAAICTPNSATTSSPHALDHSPTKALLDHARPLHHLSLLSWLHLLAPALRPLDSRSSVRHLHRHAPRPDLATRKQYPLTMICWA